MRTAASEARGGQRVVEGIVQSNGTVQGPGSSDWSVVNTATGTYVLRFTPPFRAPPVIHTTVIGYATIGVNPSSADSATVLTYTAAGASTPAGFHFRAEGRPL